MMRKYMRIIQNDTRLRIQIIHVYIIQIIHVYKMMRK